MLLVDHILRIRALQKNPGNPGFCRFGHSLQTAVNPGAHDHLDQVIMDIAGNFRLGRQLQTLRGVHIALDLAIDNYIGGADITLNAARGGQAQYPVIRHHITDNPALHMHVAMEAHIAMNFSAMRNQCSDIPVLYYGVGRIYGLLRGS